MGDTIFFAYLIAAIMFIFGLKLQGKVRTARRGNMLSSLAMLLAVIATLVKVSQDTQVAPSWTFIIIGLLAGSIIGAIVAMKVQMTSMPEMVALFNGFGGAASALVALSELVGADAVGLEQRGEGEAHGDPKNDSSSSQTLGSRRWIGRAGMPTTV